MRVSRLVPLIGDFCNNIGTKRRFAATQHFGRFRSEADIDYQVRKLPDAPPEIGWTKLLTKTRRDQPCGTLSALINLAAMRVSFMSVQSSRNEAFQMRFCQKIFRMTTS
jgi:hypothetical protein